MYFTTRNVLIAIICAIILIAYKDLLKTLILLAIFIPLGVESLRISRFIPSIDIEIVSGGALLIGYLQGPLPAFIFGIVAGFYGMVKANHIRFFKVVKFVITAIVAAGMAFFNELSFNMCFIIGIILINGVGFIIFTILDPSPLENLMHRGSHTIWNLLVVRFLFVAIYDILKFL